MSLALTKSVDYNLKPTSVKAQRKTIHVLAANKSSFSPSDTATFYLPSLPNNVMDGKSGYLRFSVAVTGAASYTDNNASSFINRIATYAAGGQLISDIQNYGALASMMLSLQTSHSEKIGMSPLIGCEDYEMLVQGGTITAGAPTTAQMQQLVYPSGGIGKALTAGTNYTFCIPILHPLFTLSDKMWPTFAMSADTRLDVTFETVINAVCGAGVTTYTITNPEIIVDYLEFDASVFGLIGETYRGRDLTVCGQDYSYYGSLLAAGTQGTVSQILPCKYLSTKAAFFGFRPADTQAQNAYSLSSRVNPFYSAGDSFGLNVAGVRIPQQPIKTVTTGQFSPYFASTQQALHAMNSLEMNGSIRDLYYAVWPANAQALATANSWQNQFCIGINLDSLAHEGINSGLNLSGVTTYWEGYIGTAPTICTGATTQSVTVDAWILHDTIYVIGADGNVAVRR